MKWLKKWSYLILLIGVGMIYLVFVDHWQVYAEPLEHAKEWCHGIGNGIYAALNDMDGGTRVEGGGPGGDGTGGTGDQGPQGNSAGMASEEGSDGAGDMTGGGSGDPSGPAAGGDGSPSGETEGPMTGGEGVPGGGSGNSSRLPGETAYMTVEDDYFADAVFIGDSRTVGMFEYAGLEETAAFYASTGLTVYKLFDSEIVDVPGERKKISVEEALQQNVFAKIYLMIGINEMGTGTVDSFIEKYQEVVDHLLELQPDAIIYLQGIIRVTTERSGQGDYINNEGIDARNERIAQMADNERVFYLDVNPLICDETGGMIPDYTFDGVHLKAKYIDIWKDFLKSHAIAD